MRLQPEQIADYRENGLLFLREIFSGAEIAALKAAQATLFERDSDTH